MTFIPRLSRAYKFVLHSFQKRNFHFENINSKNENLLSLKENVNPRNFKFLVALTTLTLFQGIWFYNHQQDIFAHLQSKYDFYSNHTSKSDKAFEIEDPNQFYSIYRNKDTDIFLDIYAPWCKFCVLMEPEYNKFSRVLIENDVKDIVVIKWNKDKFKPPISVKSVPSIFFIAAGEEDGSDLKHYNFDRQRTAREFAQFIVDAGGKSAPQVKKLINMGLFD